MKNLPFFLILVISTSVATAQNKYVRLSGGSILFGTGDVPGYAIRVEYAKNVIKSSKTRLFMGSELSFENGFRNPKIDNPTIDEFRGHTFYHITNTMVSAKASFYPFRKSITGFCLVMAPSIGYSVSSTEKQAFLVPRGNEEVRTSILSFDNRLIYGYRTGVGYDSQ